MVEIMKTNTQNTIEDFSEGCGKIGCGLIALPILIIIIFLLLGGML